MVFYFTGTGNSLYVAKQLEHSPLSIPQIIKQQNLDFTDERIGIVAPIYGHEMPDMVKEFLKQSQFHTNYFYLVLTYGNRHGGAAELAQKYCSECRIQANYINVIEMVDNWLPSFDMDEQRKINKHIDDKLAQITEDIKQRKEYIAEVTSVDRAAHQQFLSRMSALPTDIWQHMIQITDKCVGCGICEKVCPSASIRITNGKASFTPGRCQTCLACVHACPKKAIGLSIPEKNKNARYRNEHISLQEIIESNNQNN